MKSLLTLFVLIPYFLIAQYTLVIPEGVELYISTNEVYEGPYLDGDTFDPVPVDDHYFLVASDCNENNNHTFSMIHTVTLDTTDFYGCCQPIANQLLGSVLPIEFISYDVQPTQAGAVIIFEVTGNTNTYYQIERSTDGNRWKTIAVLPEGQESYRFNDNHNLVVCYYRIKNGSQRTPVKAIERTWIQQEEPKTFNLSGQRISQPQGMYIEQTQSGAKIRFSN